MHGERRSRGTLPREPSGAAVVSPESLLLESFSQEHADVPDLRILSLLPLNPQFSVFTWSGVTLGPVSRLVFILRLVFVLLPE